MCLSFWAFVFRASSGTKILFLLAIGSIQFSFVVGQRWSCSFWGGRNRKIFLGSAGPIVSVPRCFGPVASPCFETGLVGIVLCPEPGLASKPKLAFPSKPGDPSRLDAGRGESRSVRPVRSVVVYEPRPVVVIVVHSEPKWLSLSIKVESREWAVNAQRVNVNCMGVFLIIRGFQGQSQCLG